MISQLRAMEQEVVNTWVNLGKGDRKHPTCLPRLPSVLTTCILPGMLDVVGQLESIIAQAVAPGADGAALLKQAQALVQN